MADSARVQHDVKLHYETEWNKPDPWDFSEYDHAVYARIIAMLGERHYRRALEIGCGSGEFTRILAPHVDRVVAFDVAENAIARARVRGGWENVDFDVANVMEYRLDPGQAWDLIVFGETIYCLGCFYTFFEITWLVRELFRAMRPGGRLLLANCQATDESDDQHDLRPWVIRSYRDLFLNVGFVLEAEENVRVPNAYGFETLISLFTRPADP
jgi:ubiquinone/menaquinone biosynthesis C-methylase UbiE